MSVLQVQDLMTKTVATLSPGDDLLRSKALMEEKGVRHLPVVDADGRLLGLVSDRDLLKSEESSVSGVLPSEQRAMDAWSKVEWIMTRSLVTAAPDTAALDAAMLLRENKIGCLPVVDKGKLVGILTEADFVEHAIDDLSNPGS